MTVLTTFHDELVQKTAAERAAFLEIPLILDAVAGRVDRATYLRYLEQAYHHVRHTCPLLALSLANCGPNDDAYRDALFEYLAEERGHDAWILDDIASLGGNVEDIRGGNGNLAVRVMVGYGYYAVDRLTPYALLGMVHVLEGMSVELAERAAAGIAGSIGATGPKGFTYLQSHGSLDRDHVRFFEKLVNEIEEPDIRAHIVETAKIMYRLFGDVFRSLAHEEDRKNAA